MTSPYDRYSGQTLICKWCNKEIDRVKGMWLLLYPVELFFCSKEHRDNYTNIAKEKEQKSA